VGYAVLQIRAGEGHIVAGAQFGSPAIERESERRAERGRARIVIKAKRNG
jgi:hypothetical protein